MISLRQLSHALALNEHGNFGRAAEASNLSQPAFSRSVSALESALGVKLFDRTSQGVVPTAFGEAVFRHGEAILEGIGDIEREIHALQNIVTGSLSVALGVYPVALSGMPAIGRLVDRYPSLRVEARTIGWRDIADEILERRVSLGMGELSVVVNDPNFSVEPVGKHKVYFYCRAGHPLAGRRKVAASDIDNFPLAMIRLPPRVADVFPGQGRIDASSGDMIPSVEVNDLDGARRIVLNSNCIGMAVPMQIADALKGGELVLLPYRASWMHLLYGFIWLRGRTLEPAAVAFMDEVREIEKGLSSQSV